MAEVKFLQNKKNSKYIIDKTFVTSYIMCCVKKNLLKCRPLLDILENM